MKNQRIFSLASVLLMGVLILVVAMPALAAPPDTDSGTATDQFILAECDGFDVIDAYDGDWREKTYYDKDGEVTKTIYHAAMHDRIYNSVTGFEVKSVYAFNETYYPDSTNPDGDTYAARGHEFNITVPGYGVVFVLAGNIEKDSNLDWVWTAGNFSEDTALLCEAMDQSP